MTSLELRNLTRVTPRGELVIDDVSLTVPSGSTLAVVGPPGSGKSGLLRVIAGLDAPTQGEVVLDDVVVTSLDARGRSIGLVFQDFALHPHLDVHDNLAFAARLRKKVDKLALAERIDDVADLLALTNQLDSKPSDLTDAQRQRIAVGKALVRGADVQLFDEAFSAQPDRVRPHVRSVTTQWLGESGTTSVFTTSDVPEALTFGERVAVMHRGEIRQVGSAQEIYDHPADLFVAGFLGTPAMNLLPARPEGQQLVTPVFTMLLDGELERLVGDRTDVVVGVRPEDWLDATSAEGQAVTDRVEFTSRVDDVEWRGGTQLVYVGFEIEPEVEAWLEEIEDLIEFDLFQNFCVAELSAAELLKAGQSVRLVVPRDRIHVFDAETGERLSR
ncbi:hypothetical protein ASD11_02500 [Aeromicrobium sp. Root495]|uniref:ABC transporter ATP-binding protein n=1 Tax=Aeromicrobium sp. Root495 TaxID=1736550 RepID=UPI0006F68C84|nr:ABC transporter ATP-binding protein [Aeromicrobium sp. Root495]KQY58550.1 hypothetical protein ASD11_02500 [Aeromicrobium sp. Root495]